MRARDQAEHQKAQAVATEAVPTEGLIERGGYMTTAKRLARARFLVEWVVAGMSLALFWRVAGTLIFVKLQDFESLTATAIHLVGTILLWIAYRDLKRLEKS